MDTSPLREQVERSLGSVYKVERELGGGGMSRVFLAEDRALGRMIVLKVLSPELAEGMSADRFAREIRLAARLQHPHIVPLFSAGQIDGLPYYTMPYVDGESLRARLNRETTIAVPAATQILRDLARALEYAHSHDVVHRDIKPDNILLSGNSASVTDFGIAKAVSAARTQSVSATASPQELTQLGLAIGTPAYMAPEQAAGDPDIDHRADLYAFGCVAYELLAGRPPFSNRTPQALLVAHMVERPPLARLRRPDIPRTLADLVANCLAKSASDRPSTAADLLSAIETGNHPVVTPSGGVRTLASIAVLPFDSMSADKDNEYFADGITEEIINSLTQIEGLRVAGRTSSFSFKGTKHDLPTIGEKLNVDTVLEGSVRKSGNRVRITAQLVKVGDGYHLWSERYDRELTDIFVIQDEIAGSIAAKLRLSIGSRGEVVKPPTVSIQAYELFFKGRALFYQLGRFINDGIRCFEQALELDERFALAHAALADGLSLAGYYGLVRPRDIIHRAHAAALRAVELEPDIPECRHALALWMTFYGSDRKAAFAEWERAMSVGVPSSQVRSSYAIWGLGLLSCRWDDAVTAAHTAVEGDPLGAYARSMLAMAKMFARQDDGLLEDAEGAAAQDPNLFWAQWSLQRAYHHKRMHNEALAQAGVTLGMSSRHHWALAELAVEYAGVGEHDLADAVHCELLARNRIERIPPASLALTAVCARRMDEAIEICHRAIDERDAHILWSAVDRWDGWSPLYAHPGWEDVKKRISAW